MEIGGDRDRIILEIAEPQRAIAGSADHCIDHIFDPKGDHPRIAFISAVFEKTHRAFGSRLGFGPLSFVILTESHFEPEDVAMGVGHLVAPETSWICEATRRFSRDEQLPIG